MLIGGHTVLLVLRTLLTDMIARVEGAAGSTLVSLVRRTGTRVCHQTEQLKQRPQSPHSQDFDAFGRSQLAFALVGIPAAIVNSGLKYMQKKIELAFQVGS